MLLVAGIGNALLFDQLLDDRAYAQLRFAQNLLSGKGWLADPAVNGITAPWASPGFVVALAALGRMGVQLELAAIILRGLGWGLFGALVHLVARRINRPFLAHLPPVLLALNPSPFVDLLLGQLGDRSIWLNWALVSFPLKACIAGAVLIFGGWVVDQLVQSNVHEGEPRPKNSPAWLLLAVLIGLPAVGLQGFLNWQSDQQSFGRAVVEQQAAAWIAQNSPESAVVVGASRISFLANRAQLHTLPVAAVDRVPVFMQGIVQTPPDFVVSENSLPWQFVSRTGWFSEQYRPVERLEIVGDSGSPLTIWQKIDFPLAQSKPIPLAVTTDVGIDLVSYRVAAERLSPGEAIHLQLDWRVAQPPNKTVDTIVRLESPIDGVEWARRDMRTPRSVPSDWLEPGMLFSETFVLTPTADIPVGGYQLRLSLRPSGTDELSALYRPGDSAPLDRATLGYVSVPWRGEISSSATTIDATFGDQVALLSCDCPASTTAGQPVPIELFWGAVRPPDHNYVAFVHLLDGAGQYVTGIDAPPFDGRYDMLAWRPGDVIPDGRQLMIPADLPSGEYQLQVGLYLPADGVRLAAVDSAGVATPNQTIVLPSIEILGE